LLGAPGTDPYVRHYRIRLLPWVDDEQATRHVNELPAVRVPAPV